MFEWGEGEGCRRFRIISPPSPNTAKRHLSLSVERTIGETKARSAAGVDQQSLLFNTNVQCKLKGCAGTVIRYGP